MFVDFGRYTRRRVKASKRTGRSGSPLTVVQVAAVAGVAPQLQLARFVERATRDLKIRNKRFPESQLMTHFLQVINTQ